MLPYTSTTWSSSHRYACRHDEPAKSALRHGSPEWLPNTGIVNRDALPPGSDAKKYWVPSGVVTFHRSLVSPLGEAGEPSRSTRQFASVAERHCPELSSRTNVVFVPFNDIVTLTLSSSQHMSPVRSGVLPPSSSEQGLYDRSTKPGS
jgi:hypothetical protein